MPKVVVKASWSPPYCSLPLWWATDPSKATVVVLWNNFVSLHCVVTSCFCSFCEINCTLTWTGKDRGGQVKCTASACKDDFKEANKSGFCSQICLPISVESCSYISGQGYKKHSYSFPKDPTHLCAEAQHTDFVLLMPVLDGLVNQWPHASCLQRDMHHVWNIHPAGNVLTCNCLLNISVQSYKVNCNYFYIFYMLRA